LNFRKGHKREEPEINLIAFIEKAEFKGMSNRNEEKDS